MLNLGHDIVLMQSKSFYSSELMNGYHGVCDASSINQLINIYPGFIVEIINLLLLLSLDCNLSLMGLTLSTPGLINVSNTKFIRRIYTSIGTLVIVKLFVNRNLYLS